MHSPSGNLKATSIAKLGVRMKRDCRHASLNQVRGVELVSALIIARTTSNPKWLAIEIAIQDCIMHVWYLRRIGRGVVDLHRRSR